MTEKPPPPKFNQSQVTEIVKRLYRLTPTEIRMLPSYSDQNVHVVGSEGDEYILKIMNTEDSMKPNLIHVQTSASCFVHLKGLPTQTALPTISGELMSLEEADCGYGHQIYVMRLLTYLPGIMICKVPVTPQLLYETGTLAARMDVILQEFEHPYLSECRRDTFLWFLGNTPLLEAYTYILDGHPLHQVVKSVINRFKTYVVPKLSNCRRSIIHHDFNHLNLLVLPDESDGHRISGILDFGDMTDGYFIYELAVTIMHMMTEHPNPVEVGAHVFAGWESVLPLNETEKDCLYVLVMSRICQVLVLTHHSLMRHPENKEYLMLTCKNGFHILRLLWELGKEQVEKVWFQMAAHAT